MTTLWRFTSLRHGKERIAPLALMWNVEDDALSDEYSPAEVDTARMWKIWRQASPGRATTKPIFWTITSAGVFEAAPGTDPYWSGGRTFLDVFTWPVNPETGVRLDWHDLPVVDKVWRSPIPAGAITKGGFIQEATGWKPAALQPCVDVLHLERTAGI